MAKVKTFFSFILSGLLGLLGFQSCIIPAMYGCPHSDFTLKGTVTDREGNPLNGIKVKLRESYRQGDWFLDSTFTDSEGKMVINVNDMITSSDTLEVSIEDVDGDANGGKFKPATVTGSPIQTKEGHGAWDLGAYELSFQCTLDKE